MDTKTCTKCNKEFPKSPEHFFRDRTTKSGLSPWCKECKLESRKQYPVPKKEGYKICKRCFKELPATTDYFHRSSRGEKYGVRGICKECRKVEAKELRSDPAYMAKEKAQRDARRNKIRYDTFNHYSNGTFKCNCCGESHIEFLTIDHIHNDGAEERRKLGLSGAGVNFYKMLIDNGFPDGYQVLCQNCNTAKYIYGVCPHQAEK